MPPKYPKRHHQPKQQNNSTTTTTAAAATTTTTSASATSSTISSSDALDRSISECCLICAEPLQYIAIGPCNHTNVCALCTLRMRILQHFNSCCLCKQDMDRVVITKSHSKTWSDFEMWGDRGNGLEYDETAEAFFEDTAYFKQTQSLRAFTCPKCRFKGDNIDALKKHVGDAHKLEYCDLCLASRHLFLQEQSLFTKAELKKHCSKGDAEGPFKGHPMCEFCNIGFYDDNELWSHLRKEHFTCFLCERSRNAMHEFYQDYQQLEEHFRSDHILCEDPQCLQKKFVAFESDIDFTHHNATVHKGSICRGGRKSAIVPLRFRYPSPPRRGGGGGGRSQQQQESSSSSSSSAAAADNNTSSTQIVSVDTSDHAQFPGLRGDGSSTSSTSTRAAITSATSNRSYNRTPNVFDAQQFPGLGPAQPAPVTNLPSSLNPYAARGRGFMQAKPKSTPRSNNSNHSNSNSNNSSSVAASYAAANVGARRLMAEDDDHDYDNTMSSRISSMAVSQSVVVVPAPPPSIQSMSDRQNPPNFGTEDFPSLPVSQPKPKSQSATQGWGMASSSSGGKKKKGGSSNNNKKAVVVGREGCEATNDDNKAIENGSGQAIMSRIMDLLSKEEFEAFRLASALFRKGSKQGIDYYCDCADVFLLLHKHGLFTPLVNLLPDEDKKQELRELHESALLSR